MSLADDLRELAARDNPYLGEQHGPLCKAAADRIETLEAACAGALEIAESALPDSYDQDLLQIRQTLGRVIYPR